MVGSLLARAWCITATFCTRTAQQHTYFLARLVCYVTPCSGLSIFCSVCAMRGFLAPLNTLFWGHDCAPRPTVLCSTQELRAATVFTGIISPSYAVFVQYQSLRRTWILLFSHFELRVTSSKSKFHHPQPMNPHPLCTTFCVGIFKSTQERGALTLYNTQAFFLSLLLLFVPKST